MQQQPGIVMQQPGMQAGMMMMGGAKMGKQGKYGKVKYGKQPKYGKHKYGKYKGFKVGFKGFKCWLLACAAIIIWSLGGNKPASKSLVLCLDICCIIMFLYFARFLHYR